VLSGQRVDGAGSLAPLETSELATDWRTLRQQQPTGFAVSPGKLLAWHRSELDALEDATNWSAALPHLDRLIAAYPREASLYVRRAEARAELGQWEQARANDEQAIALGAGGRALSDHLALVQLALGNRAAYRAASDRLLDRLGPAPGESEVNRIAKALVLMPGAAPALERLEALLQKAVTAQPDSREARSNLGALLYRAGRYPEALERLSKVATDEDEEVEVQTRAYAGLFLAMCHRRLGHEAAARQALAAAIRLSEQAIQPKPAVGESQWVAWPYPRWTGAPPPWWERLPLQLLRREAEVLIDPTQPSAGR
jgi:tetratricopeptide (TPR) repeat protein